MFHFSKRHISKINKEKYGPSYILVICIGYFGKFYKFYPVFTKLVIFHKGNSAHAKKGPTNL